MDYIPVVIASVALAVSVLTYLRGSRKTQLEIAQTAAVRILAARTIVMWSRTLTFVSAGVNGFEVESHQKIAAKSDAKDLRQQLDVVIGLGLLGDVISNRKHALQMYEVFSAALSYQAELPVDARTEEWTREHLIMGMVRLMDVLVQWRPPVIPRHIKAELMEPISRSREHAWSYLSAPVPGEASDDERDAGSTP